MKAFTLIAIFLFCGYTAFAQQAPNTLTPVQINQGWELLFDGKSIEDWTVKSGFATYKVEDGAIVGTTIAGSPNTFLCSPEEYADFELKFEVKFDGEFFNSGVQIRAKSRGDLHGGRVYGPQVEIEASPGQAGFIYGEAAGGWQSPEPQSDNPLINTHSIYQNDGWNRYHILAEGRRIMTWINGIPVADLIYEEGRYMDNPEGFIGLQVHGIGDRTERMSVRWRNICVRPIENPKSEGLDRSAASLFNGRDFSGWKFHLGEEGTGNKGAFSVKSGVIHCPGNPRGYFHTEETYSDYIISYEWMFERPEDLEVDSLFRGNSGCLVHIGKENALGIWPASIEVQGQHRRAGLILPIPRSLRIKHSFDINAYKNAINPVGQWSTMTIDVRGEQLRVRVNGREVSQVTECELASGPVGLQSEGAPIRWQNIKIWKR